MRFTTSDIQTQREAPSNARSEGFAWLVRASYLTRESEYHGAGWAGHFPTAGSLRSRTKTIRSLSPS